MNCFICTEDIPSNDIITIECSHSYHASCYLIWDKSNNHCPQCINKLITTNKPKTYIPNKIFTDDEGNTELMIVCKEYDSTIVKRYITLDKRILDHKNNECYTALSLAARYNDDPEVTKLLLDAGANINHTFLYGRTVLMVAAQNNNPEVIKILIDVGADVNITNIGNSTALMFAAYHNKNVEVTKMLIDAGADINAKTSGDYTALSYARNGRNPEVAKLLEKLRASS